MLLEKTLVSQELISLSLLDWSEVDVIVTLYTQCFTFSFYFYCVPCVRFHK